MSDEDLAERLERARERLATVEQEVDDVGESATEQAARAYRRAARLLEDYQDRASGTGRDTFKAYVQLEANFANLVESLPDDLERREAFEEAWDRIDKRRLSEKDFERARDALEPAERFATLLDERDEAERELREARRDADRRLRELEEAVATRERLLELSAVDIDVAEDRLRDPIDRYNQAIDEGFRTFRQEVSVREVFRLLERSSQYPFVPFEDPPAALEEYVHSNPAGEYTIPQLLEYADYSRSKLSHYVDDADELKRQVATERTYLRELDAEPLQIDWPPPPAAVLETRTEELVPFVDRVAGSEAVATLRSVAALARSEDYERLREGAAGAATLSERERRHLESGDLEKELASLREELDRLSATLED